jgi:hypothetical protein
LRSHLGSDDNGDWGLPLQRLKQVGCGRPLHRHNAPGDGRFARLRRLEGGRALGLENASLDAIQQARLDARCDGGLPLLRPVVQEHADEDANDADDCSDNARLLSLGRSRQRCLRRRLGGDACSGNCVQWI